MKEQTFGKILESEYQALNSLQSHVAHVIFSELKRKYRGVGSQPDFLNAEEKKRAGISSNAYSNAIKKLVSVGLLRITGYKNINGYECRLFSFPHETGEIQPNSKSDVDLKVAYPILKVGSTAEPHSKSEVPHSKSDIPNFESGVPHSNSVPLRLDREDKEYKKEDLEDADALEEPSFETIKDQKIIIETPEEPIDELEELRIMRLMQATKKAQAARDAIRKATSAVDNPVDTTSELPATELPMLAGDAISNHIDDHEEENSFTTFFDKEPMVPTAPIERSETLKKPTSQGLFSDSQLESLRTVNGF